ncbi:putative sulfate exporter family transporter [Weeksellaceae bacterium A-14]
MIHNIPLVIRKMIFLAAAFLCMFSFMDAPKALALGFLLSVFVQHPFRQYTGRLTHYLLQFSVVGLGFGMNLHEALKVGREGFLFTVCSIFFTLLAGIFIGKVLHNDRKTSALISSGTAICGGSAIAAISPIIKADENEISVALACVFILNSIALFLFPAVGQWLNMSQHQFGLWAAVAIHDTSSVVGAAGKFGNEALQIATTVKLERALWIIPVSFIFALIYKREGQRKIKIPYFIFLFVLAILLSNYIPFLDQVSPYINVVAKKGLVLTLFLIGANLSIEAVRKVGAKVLVQGVLLWLLISVASLSVILGFA